MAYTAKYPRSRPKTAHITRVARTMLRPWDDTDWEGGRENDVKPFCEHALRPKKRGGKRRYCNNAATHILVVEVEGQPAEGEFLCTTHARQIEASPLFGYTKGAQS